MSGRAAFLDRDGVLVETLVRDGRAHAAVTLEQFRICPEAREQAFFSRSAWISTASASLGSCSRCASNCSLVMTHLTS